MIQSFNLLATLYLTPDDNLIAAIIEHPLNTGHSRINEANK